MSSVPDTAFRLQEQTSGAVPSLVTKSCSFHRTKAKLQIFSPTASQAIREGRRSTENRTALTGRKKRRGVAREPVELSRTLQEPTRRRAWCCPAGISAKTSGGGDGGEMGYKGSPAPASFLLLVENEFHFSNSKAGTGKQCC